MRMFIAIILATLSLTTFAHANDASIIKTIKEFTNFDNNYDVTGLKSVTDKKFQFLMASRDRKSLTVIPRDAFLSGVKAKKFGGHNKTLNIHNVRVQGAVANVYFTQKGKAFGFHHFAHLVKMGSEWKIVSIATHMEFYK